MAIMDAKLEFSDAQGPMTAAAAASELGTNEFVMGTVKDAWGTTITNDIGEGNNGLVVNFQVVTAASSATDMVCKVYTHTASVTSAGTSIGSTTFLASAAQIAGTKRQVRIPAGTTNKWIGITYSAVSSSLSDLVMDAWLGLDTETPST